MNIAIIGTGYVGLVTGACFAEVGYHVICVDCDARKIEHLQHGESPIYEPGLDDLVKRNAQAGRLRFTTSTQEAVEQSEVIFIAVPTPPLPDGGVDLSYIESVAREIAAHLDGYRIVVDKSTVPVRTAEKVAETIKRYGRNPIDIDVVSNPEFLREGFAVEDLMKPDRIVIGVGSDRPVAAMKAIYAPFDAPLIVTDTNSAELIKHAANSFLALKISYANALSAICEAAHADVKAVTQGMGLDRRIGTQFLNAGLGFGGSCFPKDLSAFIKISEQLGYDFRLLKEVQQINADQMRRFVKKITHALWVLKEKRIGVLGLAFKQNTDDIRTSPSLELCRQLLREGATLRVHDPKAMEKARVVLPEATFVEDANLVAEGCDALVIATEWPEFTRVDYAQARRTMRTPILFDGRNLLDPVEMKSLGFIYHSVGR
ncbi:MAG: UDP-glucose/GDP-mannose dehydrogenase family protein [Pedosphaera sp.]|nr:UDP-glucose/GDP-mannose dehydrogenase family protein [Pedosphaera sp.]